MIIFNQADNAISSVEMGSENGSFPASNTLTKYRKEVAKSTLTTDYLEFTFTGRDLLLLNTNATSGTIYADRVTAASSTISADTTYTVDTYLDGTITIADTYTVDSNDNITITISDGERVYSDDAIAFDVGLLKAKDIYFDMGSSQTWTVKIELTYSSVIEAGCLIGGDFVNYGYGTSMTKKPVGLGAVGKFESSMSSHEALKVATEDDTDFYSGIPNRDLSNAGIFVGYGKITIKDFEISADSSFLDGEQYDTATVEFK
ncbi:hypothetical protein KAR91_84595 [Candidatus Pacearchaeota archaeon]|nr:hypothetical protein [Candidatus Pacearchaeota archaeon]